MFPLHFVLHHVDIWKHIMAPSRKMSPSRQTAPGRKTWVKGLKLTFLDGFERDFTQNTDKNSRAKLYSKVTALWIKKWGYDLPLDEAPPEDSEGKDADIPDLTNWPFEDREREEKQREEYAVDLKEVGIPIYCGKMSSP